MSPAWKTEAAGAPAVSVVSLRQMLFRNAVFTSGVLAEKVLLEQAGGFDETMRYAEDYNLWLRIACEEPIRVDGEKLLIYEDVAACAAGESVRQPEGDGTGRAAELPDAPQGTPDRIWAVRGGLVFFPFEICPPAAACRGTAWTEPPPPTTTERKEWLWIRFVWL